MIIDLNYLQDLEWKEIKSSFKGYIHKNGTEGLTKFNYFKAIQKVGYLDLHKIRSSN